MDSKLEWNSKHKSRLSNLVELEPNQRLKSLSPYLTGGAALDLACGLGGNSFFLAGRSYSVEAMDLSEVACHHVKQEAEKQKLPIFPKVVDLTHINRKDVSHQLFDLVVMTYYLNRSLFPFVKSIIKENGYFFMETFYMTPLTENETISNQYKLDSNELLSQFEEWKVLYFEENELEGRQTIFCQKTST